MQPDSWSPSGNKDLKDLKKPKETWIQEHELFGHAMKGYAKRFGKWFAYWVMEALGKLNIVANKPNQKAMFCE